MAYYSRSGATLAKAMYGVFETGSRDPSLLAIAMADPAQGDRLLREFEMVSMIRRTLDTEDTTREALPLEPLFCGVVRGERLALMVPDPLAPATGREDRDAALRWLAKFQAATAIESRPWDSGDTEYELRALTEAWSVLRAEALQPVHERVAALLGRLTGESVPRCAVHGDFWHGNIAAHDDQIRIYDWEWATREGTPFLDLWTYEFGTLLRSAEPRAAMGGLEAAEQRVVAGLNRRGLDPAFAIATLAPSLGRLAIRMRVIHGTPGTAEGALLGLMIASERMLVEQ